MSVTVPEGYTVAWLLRSMNIIRSVTLNENTYNDVVCSIDYRLRVMNQYKRGVALDGVIEIILDPSTTPETFTAFSSLTKEQGTAWFEAALGESAKNQLLTRAINILQNPDYEYRAQSPWFVQDPMPGN